MHICNHNNSVIESSVNVSNTRFDILFTRRLRVGLANVFTSYFILDYFFLPAIATALPLRVRALFLVFCPRTGSPRR